jgi:hypothetical protein
VLRPVAAAAAASFLLTAPALAKPPALAGTTTIEVSQPATFDVRLPVKLKYNETPFPKFETARASVVLRALHPPAGVKEPIWRGSGEPGYIDYENLRALPAGEYRLYVLPEAGASAIVELSIAQLAGTLELKGGVPVPVHESTLEGTPSPDYPGTVRVGAPQALKTSGFGWASVKLSVPDPGAGRVQWCEIPYDEGGDLASFDVNCGGHGGTNYLGNPAGAPTSPVETGAEAFEYWGGALIPLAYGGNASSPSGSATATLHQRWLDLAEADAVVVARNKRACRRRAAEIQSKRRRKAALRRCKRL